MVILNPITLPFSKYATTMTTLIGDLRFNDTLATSDIVNDFVSSCRIGQVEYGKGIVNTFKVGLQPIENLTETSTAFKITKPNVAQETILIDQFMKIPLSISEILTKDAVLKGESLSTFIEFVMGLLQDTSQFYLFGQLNTLIQEWEPGQATQTIEIEQINTQGMTGVELNNAMQWNATNIAKVMRKTLNNMKILNSKFTDVATYVDANTGQSEPVMTALRGDNLKFIVNDNYWTNFLADAMASLYHNEKIGEMIPGDEFRLLPTDAITEDNELTIAWLSAKNKFALADFYKVTMSIVDPSTTYTNIFLHFAYGMGIFKYAPGVKFVAKLVEPGEITA